MSSHQTQITAVSCCQSDFIHTRAARQYQYKASACVRASVFAYLAVLLTTQVSLLSQCPPPQAERNSSSTVETTVRWWKRGISVSRQATHLMAQYVITQMIALQWSLPRRAEQKGSSCSACSDLSWRPAWLFPTRRRHCVVSLPLDDGTFLHLVPPKPLHVLEIQY